MGKQSNPSVRKMQTL